MTTTKSHGQSDNNELDEEIKIKEGARVMLTKNIAIADRLINNQLGTICKIKFDNLTNKVSAVYVNFDKERAGKDTIRNSGDYY